MMKLLAVFLCLTAFLSTSSASSSETKTTYFKLTSGPSCSNGISLSNVEATCDGYNCRLGDDLTATGSITFPGDVPSSVCMTTTACFMGISMSSLCRTFSDDNVDLMSEMNLQSTSSDNSYTFDSNIQVPGEENSIGTGWWVTAVTTLDDCAGTTYTECTTKIKAKGDQGSYSYTTATVAASLFCMGAVALFVRRRRVGKIDLALEEARAGHFEMMSDFGPGSAPVGYGVDQAVRV